VRYFSIYGFALTIQVDATLNLLHTSLQCYMIRYATKQSATLSSGIFIFGMENWIGRLAKAE
jgi:hypothetical protein